MRKIASSIFSFVICFFLLSNFLEKEKRSSKFNNIQSMFLRAKLSKTEIQTLWGMIKKLKKRVQNQNCQNERV